MCLVQSKGTRLERVGCPASPSHGQAGAMGWGKGKEKGREKGKGKEKNEMEKEKAWACTGSSSRWRGCCFHRSRSSLPWPTLGEHGRQQRSTV